MSALLEVDSLFVGYGDIRVLEGVSLRAEKSEVVSIVGANGAGKTTLLSSLAGLIKPVAGKVRLLGEDITYLPPHDRPERRMVLVAEGGRLFPYMTVRENLLLGAYPVRARKGRQRRIEEVCQVFPILLQRANQLAGSLSGGERQMCAIARAMMSYPDLLMLDEPSVGLSPLMVETVFQAVRNLAMLEGVTVLLVEQNVSKALGIADRGYVLDHGRVVLEGNANDLKSNRQIQETYMGL